MNIKNLNNLLLLLVIILLVSCSADAEEPVPDMVTFITLNDDAEAEMTFSDFCDGLTETADQDLVDACDDYYVKLSSTMTKTIQLQENTIVVEEPDQKVIVQIGGNTAFTSGDLGVGSGLPMVTHLFNTWCGDNAALGFYCNMHPTFQTLHDFCSSGGQAILAANGFVVIELGGGKSMTPCSDVHLGFVQEDINLKMNGG